MAMHLTRGRAVAIPLGLAAFLTGVAALTPATGQTPDDRMYRPPEATIYRDPGFSGPAVFVGEAKGDLDLNWPVNSIRVASGTWELCQRTNFRAPCIIVNADTPMLMGRLPRNQVQSMRPVAGPGGGGWGGFRGPSLRGMAAEFYSEPMEFGRRVSACIRGPATATCAANTADRFCKTAGWKSSARQAVQTVDGRVVLADVLCTQTGY